MQPSGASEDGAAGDRLSTSAIEPPTRTPTILRLGLAGHRHSARRGALHDHRLLRVARRRRRCRRFSRTRTTARKDVTGWRRLPDGTERSLIHIKDWDFRWQHVYRYEQPIRAAEGHARVDATTPTTTPRRTRAIRSSRRSGCFGDSARSTRWAICGFSSSPTQRSRSRAR